MSSSPQAADELRRLWLRLLELSAEDIRSDEVLDSLLNETLLCTVRAISVVSGDRDRRRPRTYRLARCARDFMLDRKSNPSSIAQVCSFLNVSERTLHYAFNDTYGVSPKQFLKARRLFAARHGLKCAAPDECVSDVAVRLGFWDLSYFSRDYKAMFGELPSVTLRGYGR